MFPGQSGLSCYRKRSKSGFPEVSVLDRGIGLDVGSPMSGPRLNSMIMKRLRLCVYPKDISLLLGLSERHARRLLQQIKDAYGKRPHQYVSFQEFAQYTDLPLEEVVKRCL